MLDYLCGSPSNGLLALQRDTSEHATSGPPSPQSMMQFSCWKGLAGASLSSPGKTSLSDLHLFVCLDVLAHTFLPRKEGLLAFLQAVFSLRHGIWGSELNRNLASHRQKYVYKHSVLTELDFYEFMYFLGRAAFFQRKMPLKRSKMGFQSLKDAELKGLGPSRFEA